MRSVDVESWVTDPHRLLLLLAFSGAISLHSVADVYQKVEKHQAETSLFQNIDAPLRPFAYFSYFLLWVTPSVQLLYTPLRRFAYFCFGHTFYSFLDQS